MYRLDRDMKPRLLALKKKFTREQAPKIRAIHGSFSTNK